MGYHSEVYWADIQAKNTPGFKVYIHSDDIYLRMLTPENSKMAGNSTIHYPKGDISFLHGINAIGSKFGQPSKFGPQSLPYHFKAIRLYGGKLKMKLTFDFN